MKKGVLIFTVSFFLLSFPLFAQVKSHIVDNAGLLSGAQIQEIEKSLVEISSTYNFDLVIVTEKNINGESLRDYADDYFDYNGYGSGENADGCLFLQVTETRDYWFSTTGRGIKILNSTAFNKLTKDVVKYLKADDPANAYRAFIGAWKTFLALDAKGKSYNIITEYAPIFYIVAWFISLVIALLIVQGMKSKMSNVHPKTEADRFIIPGSLVFTHKRDKFLYSTVTKSQRESSTSSGGSHTGSSGRSHGGGGGHY